MDNRGHSKVSDLSGNPVAIVVSSRAGRLSLLQWDNVEREIKDMRYDENGTERMSGEFNIQVSYMDLW